MGARRCMSQAESTCHSSWPNSCSASRWSHSHPMSGSRVHNVVGQADNRQIETLILGDTTKPRRVLLPAGVDRRQPGGNPRPLRRRRRISRRPRPCRARRPSRCGSAIARDMVVEAVLETRRCAGSDGSQRYRRRDLLAPAQGSLPTRTETRLLRHLLVTINERLPGNELQAARARIESHPRPPAQGTAAFR
jgi:hypothetical protein